MSLEHLVVVVCAEAGARDKIAFGQDDLELIQRRVGAVHHVEEPRRRPRVHACASPPSA